MQIQPACAHGQHATNAERYPSKAVVGIEVDATPEDPARRPR